MPFDLQTALERLEGTSSASAGHQKNTEAAILRALVGTHLHFLVVGATAEQALEEVHGGASCGDIALLGSAGCGLVCKVPDECIIRG